MVDFPYKDSYTMEDLIQVLRILRGPEGCPWDQEQTHLSTCRNFLEEAYEAVEAFEQDNPVLMCEELGDVLLQVLFHIHIEEDAGRFCTEDVITGVCQKMIYRHPHVFGSRTVSGSEEVLVNWEQLKQEEKQQRTVGETMDAVARSLPSLWRAEKIQKKQGCSTVVETVLPKVEQGAEALIRALQTGENGTIALGELLLATVGAARCLGIDPEEALHTACERQIAAQKEQDSLGKQ